MCSKLRKLAYTFQMQVVLSSCKTGLEGDYRKLELPWRDCSLLYLIFHRENSWVILRLELQVVEVLEWCLTICTQLIPDSETTLIEDVWSSWNFRQRVVTAVRQRAHDQSWKSYETPAWHAGKVHQHWLDAKRQQKTQPNWEQMSVKQLIWIIKNLFFLQSIAEAIYSMASTKRWIKLPLCKSMLMKDIRWMLTVLWVATVYFILCSDPIYTKSYNISQFYARAILFVFKCLPPLVISLIQSPPFGKYSLLCYNISPKPHCMHNYF